ncbi:non-ribosomal peptide synthetase [Kibdelosporangium persicum]|uniref:Amino acid adenylation domain-containing protein n=1 Tax=Kibdelosporangium persicum TaxID=2698649 RepID=A0ABX2FHC9_9PSEU|nr:non-ribosomal peptide synthetase [Kibdelosporangium persicum]NRN70672.1 Amino acid adenylation domain-containing protein [Kibdelosporangium persicum]
MIVSGTSYGPEAPATVLPAQLETWFAEQLAGTTAVFHRGKAFRFLGRVDADRLAAAMTHVMRRHEALRTTFESVDGVPLPRRSDLRADVVVVDTDGLTDRQRAALARAQVSHPFDLPHGPLVRIRLYRSGPEDHLLVLVAHSMVCDLESLDIVLADLCAAYTSASPGLVRLPAPAGPSWSAAAAATREWLGTGAALDSLSYWLARLAGVPDRVAWPRARPGGQAVTVCRPVGPGLAAGVAGLAARHGTTSQTVLLTALRVLLSRYTGQPDLLIATPMTMRTDQTAGVVGQLGNLVVLRNDLRENPSFAEGLADEHHGSSRVGQAGKFPFALLATALKPSTSPASGSVVQVHFHDEPAPSAGPAWPGVRVDQVALDLPTTMCDLSLTARTHHDGTVRELVWASATGELDDVSVRDLADRFVILLQDAITNPEKRVAELRVLSPRDERALDRYSSPAPLPVPEQATLSLIDLVYHWVGRSPDTVAIRCGTDALTYHEFGALSKHIAQRITDLRLPLETRVGVLLSRSAELPAVLLGVAQAGCTVVPLDPTHPPDRLAYVLRDSGARVLITDGIVDGLVIDDSVRVLPLAALRTGITESVDGPITWPADLLDRAAYVLYTSGSTGTPKGIAVTHRGLANCLLATRELLGFQPGQSLLAVTTISFDIATLELYLPLISGGQTVVAGSSAARDGDALKDLLAAVRPDFMQATPMTWQMLFLCGWPGDPDLVAHVGGDLVTPELAARLTACTKAMWHTYGPTEASMYMACEPVPRGPQPPVLPIGRPIGGAGVLIVDRWLQPVPPGTVGELCIRGVCLARGYPSMPGFTATRFIPDPLRPGERVYRTGDLAMLRPDGRIELRGRNDRQVKIRGHRAEPGEVETILGRHPDVAMAAVVISGTGSDSYRIVAYLQPTEEAGESVVDNVREYASRLLPAFLVPSSYVVVKSMPLNPNGKTDRAVLARLSAWPPAVDHRPRRQSREEEWVTTTWSAVLGTAEVSAASFFRQGGDLVRAAKVVARAKQELGIDLALETVVESPTIPALARRIRCAMVRGGSPRADVTSSWLAESAGRLPPLVLLTRPDDPSDYTGLAAALEPGRGMCRIDVPDEHGLTTREQLSGLLTVIGSDSVVLAGRGDGGRPVLRTACALYQETGLLPPVLVLGGAPPDRDAVAGYRGSVYWVADVHSIRTTGRDLGRRPSVVALPGGPEELLGDANCTRVAGVVASMT